MGNPKCTNFKVGDRVRWSRPGRDPITGTVRMIEWHSGRQDHILIIRKDDDSPTGWGDALPFAGECENLTPPPETAADDQADADQLSLF